jgi:hypothetical protein
MSDEIGLDLIGKDTGAEKTRDSATPADEFEQLRAKTAEILNESALAHERMAKDQEEIEQLKTETRALLKQLRAA